MAVVTGHTPGFARRAANSAPPLLLLLALGLGLAFGTPRPLLAATDATIAPAPAVYPGINEIVPRSTALSGRALDAAQRGAEAELLLELETNISGLKESFDALEQQFARWEQVSEWPLSALLEARTRYAELQTQQDELLRQISPALKSLEEIQLAWTEELAFWEGWQESLRATWQKGGKPARELFARTLALIRDTLDRNARTSGRLLGLQQSIAAQQELVAGRIRLIDGASSTLREDTFRRNAPSIFDPEFYAQFTEGLNAELRRNMTAALHVSEDFLRGQGRVAILQVIFCLIAATLLKLRRRQPRPVTQELRFLYNHPWAGAIFLSLLLTAGLYANPPAIWRWGLTLAGAASATVLVVAMYRQVIIRRLIRLVAIIFILSSTVQMIGLPRPLLQLSLVLICLIIVLIGLALAWREGHDTEATRSGLTMLLNIGAMVGIIGLVAGLVGFVIFSARLVDVFVGTIMVILGTNMAIRIADGGILALMKKDWVRGQRFVKKLGIQTTERLQTILHLTIYANAFVYLFVAWNVYETFAEAWSSLLALEYAIGDFSISLQMVLMLAMVLYLTSLSSWILQAFLDAQVLSPRGMAFGVRSAFKRLVHYALFTVGFFIASSMAGVSLEKFAIVAGALGVGIGFGLQNIVNNFISGLILLFERPIKIGDTISLDSQLATVTKIGLRSTTVETIDRAEVIVPNADLISQKVTNWTLSTNVSRVTIAVGVAYGSNLEAVLAILDTVARSHPDVLADPEPNAIFTGFGESSIDFELRFWIGDIAQRLKVKSDLGRAVDHHFREAGITIPFPQRDLHLRSIESNLHSLLKGSSAAQPSDPEGRRE